jgi:hypothetical protein
MTTTTTAAIALEERWSTKNEGLWTKCSLSVVHYHGMILSRGVNLVIKALRKTSRPSLSLPSLEDVEMISAFDGLSKATCNLVESNEVVDDSRKPMAFEAVKPIKSDILLSSSYHERSNYSCKKSSMSPYSHSSRRVDLMERSSSIVVSMNVRQQVQLMN